MVERLFRRPTANIFIQVFRYILAGGVAYIIDYSSLIVCIEIFKVYYLTAAAAAFLLGLLTSYILNVVWVFDRKVFSNKYVETLIFAFIGGVGLILNQHFIWFFTENINLHYLFSKFFSTIIVFVWSFSARKYILFR
ncbi:MAG: GtrA family protein [Candidatus Makaraimicrobium thalassicum]|nr:MAG: GtrA family protein [Candidatus Omnitrophota bacterium]